MSSRRNYTRRRPADEYAVAEYCWRRYVNAKIDQLQSPYVSPEALARKFDGDPWGVVLSLVAQGRLLYISERSVRFAHRLRPKRKSR